MAPFASWLDPDYASVPGPGPGPRSAPGEWRPGLQRSRILSRVGQLWSPGPRPCMTYDGDLQLPRCSFAAWRLWGAQNVLMKRSACFASNKPASLAVPHRHGGTTWAAAKEDPSNYKGITRDRKDGKWRVRINFHRKRCYLGK
jgi:hypothetical protein